MVLSGRLHLALNFSGLIVNLRAADANGSLAFLWCRQIVERRLAALDEFLSLFGERFAGDLALLAP
jgi:hypothetical protein